jgi:hypothetical protein
MKAGNRIRVNVGNGMYDDWQDFTVEEFRFCLGIFLSDESREAGHFTPLCDIYCDGPESEGDYISNFGSYRTNQVPAWCDIP